MRSWDLNCSSFSSCTKEDQCSGEVIFKELLFADYMEIVKWANKPFFQEH